MIPSMDMKSALARAQRQLKDKGIPSAPLDAEVLLLASLNAGREPARDKSWLYLHLHDHELTKREAARFHGYIARRLEQEPVAYITGRKEFYGRDFYVDKSVLIPRVETELIVDEALEVLRATPMKEYTLLDLGTGSGCIPVSILASMKEHGLNNVRRALACDISEAALKTARKNAKAQGVNIRFRSADLSDAIDELRTRKDVIVTANLPYISPADYAKLAKSVKGYEPKLALTTKDNGLLLMKKALEAFSRLAAGFDSYHLLLEADPKQMRALESHARKLLMGIKCEAYRDLRGKQRMMHIYNL